MFSDAPRCRYHRGQLAEVICQLRFPEILTIEAKAPAEFQEAIREEYPGFLRRNDTPGPRITGVPGSFTLENQPSVLNYQFSSPDGVWRVNLTGKFLSLSCSRYTSWEEFAGRLDKPLAAFIQVYKPAYFERVGLRYLNFLSRKDLDLEGVPFRELIQPCYLGLLGEEDVREDSASRASLDTELAIRSGCRARIHAGPGLVKKNGTGDSEVRFIFDQDLYMPGQLPVKLTVGALQTLHFQADSIFRGAITDRLHEAMDPELI